MSCVILFFILMTTLFYKALMLQGEIWCWPLLGLKGYKGYYCPRELTPGYSKAESCVTRGGVNGYIHNLSPSLPKHEILSKVKWHSLSYFYKKRLACIAYQAYFNLAPSNLTKVFTKHATKYNLRDNLKFDLTHKFWKGQNDSFIHRASIIWNSLPTKIKTAFSLAAFKASLVKNSKCIDSISF